MEITRMAEQWQNIIDNDNCVCARPHWRTAASPPGTISAVELLAYIGIVLYHIAERCNASCAFSRAPSRFRVITPRRPNDSWPGIWLTYRWPQTANVSNILPRRTPPFPRNGCSVPRKPHNGALYIIYVYLCGRSRVSYTHRRRAHRRLLRSFCLSIFPDTESSQLNCEKQIKIDLTE